MNQKGNRPTWRRCQSQPWGCLPFCGNQINSVFGNWARKSILLLLLFNCFATSLSAELAENSKNIIYHPASSFKIPFDVDPLDKLILKSIELYVSDDLGVSWRLSTATGPTSKSFPFRGNGDGEYWFAVRTLDNEGRYNPADDKPIVPDWRVVVDTKKPSLGITGISRKGSSAVIRWDARDENLDLGTLVLEFSVSGSGQWRPIPIGRPLPNGEIAWDTGTAQPILLRGTVADKAGNMQTAESEMSDGAAQRPISAPGLSETMEGNAPPPIAQMASAGNRRGILGPHSAPSVTPSSVTDEWVDTPTYNNQESIPGTVRGNSNNRFSSESAGGLSNQKNSDRAIAGTGSLNHARPAPLVNTPKFPLNYSVEDAGPNGPATVELWVTKDSGRNWSRWSEDSDRISPMQVDLGGEGLFGISIVARSLAGQGDEIPRTGTAPQLWVEVDSTPPSMVLNVIKVGVGSQTGKVLISWRAEDRNFGDRPISLYYRPETANQWMPIAEGIENTGQYVWAPGPQVPPVFHIKIDARDDAGNQSSVDTTNYEPVLLDRSRPRARIIGLSMAGQNSQPEEPRTYKPILSDPTNSSQASARSESVRQPIGGNSVNQKVGGNQNAPTDKNNLNQASPGAASHQESHENEEGRNPNKSTNAQPEKFDKPKSSISADQFNVPQASSSPEKSNQDTSIGDINQSLKPESSKPLLSESAPPVKPSDGKNTLNLDPPTIAPESGTNPNAEPAKSKAIDTETRLPDLNDIPLPEPIAEPPPSLMD